MDAVLRSFVAPFTRKVPEWVMIKRVIKSSPKKTSATIRQSRARGEVTSVETGVPAKMATQNPPELETDDSEQEEGEGYGSGGGLNPEIKPSGAGVSGQPLLCLIRFASDSAAGALMGSVFGYGSGLMKKKGFKGSFADAGSLAKTFAVLSGVHSLVSCLLKRLRGKDDVINAGIAGCCTGFVFSFPGQPHALLQSCLTFGAFSSIIEGFYRKQAALAQPYLARQGSFKGPDDVLPPFTLPFPHQLWEGFSSFCQSLPKSKGIASD
ncbi:unnamed protein product [Musa hybrid cultivar]